MPVIRLRRPLSILAPVCALAGLGAVASCNDKASDTSEQEESTDVTTSLDARFAGLVAALPRVDRGAQGPLNFEYDDFKPGLKTREVTTGDRTDVKTFTLNEAGLPTKITEKEHGEDTATILTAEYAGEPAKPIKIVRYEKSSFRDGKWTREPETTTLTWSTEFPIFLVNEALQETVTRDGKRTSKLTCSSSTTCRVESAYTPKSGKASSASYDLTFAGPRLAATTNETLTTKVTDGTRFTIKNTYKDGAWTGSGTSISGTTYVFPDVTPLPAVTPPSSEVPTGDPTPNPTASPSLSLDTSSQTPWRRRLPFLESSLTSSFVDALALASSQVPFETSRVCTHDAKGVSTCKGADLTDGRKSSEETVKNQLVLELTEGIGSIEGYPLESTETSYEKGSETVVDRKTVAKYTYDTLWRLTKKVVTRTTKSPVFGDDGVATGAFKDVTSVEETKYTWDGDTRRPKTETTTLDGSTTEKIVYTY